MKKPIFLLTNSFYLLIIGFVCFQTPTFLSAQTPCDCVPMLYESFNYDAGTTLHQKVGGTGWNGIWENQGGDSS